MATNYPQLPQEPSSAQVPREPEGTVRALSGVMANQGPSGPSAAGRHGRGHAAAGFLSGPGKALFQHVSELVSRKRHGAAREGGTRESADRTRQAAEERRQGHPGGNRTWMLRLLIPVGGAAEAVTAYVGVEALVASQSLAVGLSALTAAVGVGLACLLATRRLDGIGVPATIRILEGIFVATLTVLRYESLSIQGSDYLTAAAAAGLAALISMLGLLGIEEIVVKTHTFAIFVGALRASWAQWRWRRAAAALAATSAAAEAAADRLQRRYLEYLVRTEELPPEEADGHAAALRATLTGSEAAA
jgi:hypothetical protein